MDYGINVILLTEASVFSKRLCMYKMWFIFWLFHVKYELFHLRTEVIMVILTGYTDSVSLI